MPVDEALDVLLSEGGRFGQILVRKAARGFILRHRDDAASSDPKAFYNPEDAIEIARYDDAGNYRPLKTAPNLRRGWRLEIRDATELRSALDHFYPGRLAVLAAWHRNGLTPTSLRESLNRQSGMYRVATKISDEQIDEVVGNFCRSDSGCLRTILWGRDDKAPASGKLPGEKFDPAHDQTGRGENAVPLLCQEACGLLVNECRKVVKGETEE